MAKNPSEKANKPLADDEPTNPAATVNPVEEPARNSQPQHLLTPLAALWPTATLPMTVKVTFTLLEPGAKQVFLCGEFNGWASDATPMKRQADGHWETTVALAPGRHEYKFVVDGIWKHDPLARVNVWNQNGSLNSVAQVRA
jgi:1,4-alpha-glucan branching enzyme